MPEPSSNIQLTSEAAETVARFINSTAAHVFLTGKAGTGKTTFLKNLAHKTHKNFIVVAPTGIAALNAGGVTIHSQFLFPMGMFLPERNIPQDLQGREVFYTSDILARRHPLNSTRKQVLRAIDLLVIDEVSMLRADLLDAIDYRLKAARGNFRQSFGGVQLLLIGDLFQLPPVVGRDEMNLMSRYYPSPWFFESVSLKASPPAYIELDKIYRQHDQKFIDLLNSLRNNIATSDDIQLLNKHYKSDEEIRAIKEVITLTTHNYKADELNQKALQILPNRAYTFKAKIENDFPESMFPVLRELVLKVGAQIMFVKNDAETKQYFNGKLATVISIDDEEVIVEMAETHSHYTLSPVVWENKKYTLHTEKQDLTEEVIGTFEQFPIKLAWAITVHKSQGLTFEKAIVDVGQAFADGQVYVALSRLRSMEGLILRSRIHPGVISTDKTIVSYSEENHKPEALPGLMQQEQYNFLKQLLAKTFDFSPISKEIEYFKKKNEEEVLSSQMKSVPTQIDEALLAERINTEKFVYQLAGFWNSNQLDKILDRVEKGTGYYKLHITKILVLLVTHIKETQLRKRVKTYLTHLNELDQMLSKKLEEFEKALFLAHAIINRTNQYDFTEMQKQLQTNRISLLNEVKVTAPASDNRPIPVRKIKPKKDAAGKSTYDITLEMLNNDMTIEAIAKERSLTLGTIEGHLAKAVGSRRISIYKFMPEEEVSEIEKIIREFPTKEFSSKDLYEKLNGKYSYGKLRAVITHRELE